MLLGYVSSDFRWNISGFITETQPKILIPLHYFSNSNFLTFPLEGTMCIFVQHLPTKVFSTLLSCTSIASCKLSDFLSQLLSYRGRPTLGSRFYQMTMKTNKGVYVENLKLLVNGSLHTCITSVRSSS
jgi:hypothetical protein